MRIETERLTLRRLTTDDLDELVALQQEPDVARFMGAYDRAEMASWLQSSQEEWDRRGHGRVAIVERSTERLVGRTGLRHWPEFDETEVGWALRAPARGRGYATEAARACLEWGFRDLDDDYLTAMVHPKNARAIAVAERLGMRPLRRDVLLGEPVIVYAISGGDRSPGPRTQPKTT
jgi:RimJ/RimL family protein N-acetyltransferase